MYKINVDINLKENVAKITITRSIFPKSNTLTIEYDSMGSSHIVKEGNKYFLKNFLHGKLIKNKELSEKEAKEIIEGILLREVIGDDDL